MSGADWAELAVSAAAAGCARGAPMLLAATGEILAERSGVLNLGLEGLMLAGAVAAAAAAHTSGSILLGLAAALVVAGLLGLLHAVVCVVLRADQIVAGLALSFLAAGAAAVAGAPLVGVRLPALAAAPLPLLGDLPVLGRVLFRHSLLVYAAVAVAVLAHLYLTRTRLGLWVRAAGEAPDAALAAGVPVARLRVAHVVAGAALAGLGGATLSLAVTPGWVDGMVAGQGWIALGLVIVARWRPLPCALGAFLFGLVRRLPLDLQGSDVPLLRDPSAGYFLNMLPYLVAVAVLAVVAGRARGRGDGRPAALGR